MSFSSVLSIKLASNKCSYVLRSDHFELLCHLFDVFTLNQYKLRFNNMSILLDSNAIGILN